MSLIHCLGEVHYSNRWCHWPLTGLYAEGCAIAACHCAAVVGTWSQFPEGSNNLLISLHSEVKTDMLSRLWILHCILLWTGILQQTPGELMHLLAPSLRWVWSENTLCPCYLQTSFAVFAHRATPRLFGGGRFEFCLLKDEYLKLGQSFVSCWREKRAEGRGAGGLRG